ncbi:MAG: NAD-dependent epimerase/dehydratase family protein [Flavobacteriales bacterium]|nr:NAD-dependent epimerase/dehydratase family protein [Flavobacteriales bacterium]MCB0808084.1 NAD-dependent epimerase/dehydratase family protein [Flavobacteriales bacterium]MCB9201335.1 NAD-dependent epimerase/dehydratase family protein [Flavobacteriales bacterium]HPJ51917.1 NAD-dependent epimerase/dehydratase family protein [Flavobacteriales bacterium]HRW88540.1 NAD-dependent epimerase/dehydratase family protein [Flavobacteriales bacterium]
MARVLVTGGAGFIGSELVIKLAHAGHQVVAVDDLTTGDLGKLPLDELPGAHFIKCDVNRFEDISSVFYAHRPEYVFHYAAVVGVKRTIENPVMVLRDVDGIRNILDLSKNTGVRRVFYSSSSEVYGEPVEIPQNERTTPLNSKLPYAIVKNLGEAFLRSYQKEFGLDYTVFRFFNTYGPRQSRDFVVSKFIRAALKGEDITIYGDGAQTRTFCYIDDNVDACLAAFRGEEVVNDVVNIGSDQEIGILDLAKEILALTGSSSRIVHLPPLEEGDMTRRMPDVTRMRKLLGREPLPLRDGLQHVLADTRFIL